MTIKTRGDLIGGLELPNDASDHIILNAVTGILMKASQETPPGQLAALADRHARAQGITFIAGLEEVKGNPKNRELVERCIAWYAGQR